MQVSQHPMRRFFPVMTAVETSTSFRLETAVGLLRGLAVLASCYLLYSWLGYAYVLVSHDLLSVDFQQEQEGFEFHQTLVKNRKSSRNAVTVSALLMKNLLENSCVSEAYVG